MLLFLAFLVDRQAEVFLKLTLESFHELTICDVILGKELEGALNNWNVRLTDSGNLLGGETSNQIVEVLFVFVRLRNGSLSLEQHHRLQTEMVSRRD